MSAHRDGNPECDVTIYANVPGAKGVACTCDVESAYGPPNPLTLPAPAMLPGQIVLVGAQAEAHHALRAKGLAARAAQEAAERANREFQQALAAYLQVIA